MVNKDKRSNSRSDASQGDFLPPDYIFPNVKEIPLVPLHLNAHKLSANAGSTAKPNTCLKQLTFSGWNPPQGKRKMRGDLMYLHVITNEDKRYHLTASVKGFFVNQCVYSVLFTSQMNRPLKFVRFIGLYYLFRSSDDVFNPKQDNSHKLYHSLIDLLNMLSPSFKKNFSAIQKKRYLLKKLSFFGVCVT